jgi:regulator of sirC expression with transglutaminase-like and TPR domain
MPLSFTAPTPLEYFRTLVQSDAEFPLLETTASLAQDTYPELDTQQVLGDVDQLLARLHRRVKVDAPALQRLQLLNDFYFGELGFGGNVNNYYDPDNSYLNAVLRTRRGIPISLAVVWLELAHGLGLAAYGVGFPGHFMVKLSLPHGHVVLDPFTGQSLSREQLLERLEPYQRFDADEGDFEVPLGLYLQAMPPRAMVGRMLRNLKEIYRSQHNWASLLKVQNRLVVLLPDAWSEVRERAETLALLGEEARAIADLEAYLPHAEDAQERQAARQRLAGLRRHSL